MRQKFYPCFLGACGKKVLFGRFININNPGKIHIGENVVINDNVELDGGDYAEETPAITLEDRVFIGTGSRLQANGGKIVLRAGSSVGSFCIFEATGNITAQQHVLFAAFCRIGYSPQREGSRQQDEPAAKAAVEEISIMDGCWLGVRSVIQPGVVVGEGTVVGAHAIVRHSLPSFVVAVGAPAKVIRNRFE